ncbi:MAG: FAD-dependent oxidoreductase [Planctomycetaceae bacterium]|nr:FAD-dependent oxidoreductase [Planctomycetaceae bacterium]
MSSISNKPHIAVIGAGAMGGWTAWHLRQQGMDVTLVDAWGPGHSRASSGGETRVIRGIYGQDRLYVEWVVRALELWNALGEQWNERLYHKTGLLWMFVAEDDYAKLSIPVIEEFGLAVDPLPHADAERRFPQVNFNDVRSIYFEREAGYLKARHACRVVCEQFQQAGGSYRQSAVQPEYNQSGEIEQLILSDGSRLQADQYLFACGPWLPKLFPEVLGSGISLSRQEVYYFGPPAGTNCFETGQFPAWINFDEPFHYGLPSVEGRGFKIADDSRMKSIDPTDDPRIPSVEGIEKAKSFLGHRFPLLKDAPLIEARVCQYTNSPDGHLIVDRHPDSDNVWIAGAGSGHSFKLGPALGEHIAACMTGDASPLEMFSLSRLKNAVSSQSQHGTH